MTNANTVAMFFYKEIICRFEVSRILQSDRKIHFINKVIQRLIKRFKIWYSLLLSYHSQLNELVERLNKTFYKEIAKLAKEVDQ